MGLTNTSKNTKISGCQNQAQDQAQAVVKPQTFPLQQQGSPPLQRLTKITVKCDCGFPNTLYLRGEGIAGLSWNKGVPMKNVKPDEWVWETNKPFITGQYKVLINDKQYETGENHPINCGTQVCCTPKF